MVAPRLHSPRRAGQARALIRAAGAVACQGTGACRAGVAREEGVMMIFTSIVAVLEVMCTAMMSRKLILTMLRPTREAIP